MDIWCHSFWIHVLSAVETHFTEAEIHGLKSFTFHHHKLS